MKKHITKFIILLIMASLLFSFPPINKRLKAEVVVCPGSGEKCAQVYIWGIGLWWKKKTPGGPGIILIDE